MKVKYKMIWKMDGDNITILLDRNMLAFSNRIKFKDMEGIYFYLEHNTKEIGAVPWNMELEYLNLLIMIFIKENSLMTYFMEKVYINILMVIFLKEFGKKD